MANSPRLYYILALAVILMGLLTGCQLPRNGDENLDTKPVEQLPPTLAPLGAESSSMATEATPIPTVINVQATVTVSPLGTGEAAPSPNETVAPTNQPPSVPPTPVVPNSQAEQVAAAPETFIAPTSQPAPAEPVVVDATSPETASTGPVAANPPASGVESVPADGNYTVQPGDTLFGISMRFGTTVEAIQAANGLRSDLVQVGQVLFIPTGDSGYYPQPAAPQAPMMGGPEGMHVVVPGETLFSIAMQYGTSVEAIAEANGIAYPYVIYVGQPLAMPGGGAYPQPMRQPMDYYPPQPMPQGPDGNYYPPQPGNFDPGMAGTHVVAPGETLYSIAQRYGTTAQALAEANGLVNPNQIFVGQVLYLP